MGVVVTKGVAVVNYKVTELVVKLCSQVCCDSNFKTDSAFNKHL